MKLVISIVLILDSFTLVNLEVKKRCQNHLTLQIVKVTKVYSVFALFPWAA
jgi:uncharacterized membrane protein